MTSFQVVEIFESIQGESSFSGLPCAFIRFAGCNLDCGWCDTPQAKKSAGLQIDISAILCKIKQTGLKYVCLTGGEPLLQRDIGRLMQRLLDEEIVVSIETNGSLDWTWIPDDIHCCIDIKCPSSGMHNSFRMDCLKRLRAKDEIKFVIADHDDYEYAKNIFLNNLVNFDIPVFASPVHKELDPSLLARWILSDKIPFRIHLQIHKILGIK
ncbi:MAG: radical SAM protein [bacterium]